MLWGHSARSTPSLRWAPHSVPAQNCLLSDFRVHGLWAHLSHRRKAVLRCRQREPPLLLIPLQRLPPLRHRGSSPGWAWKAPLSQNASHRGRKEWFCYRYKWEHSIRSPTGMACRAEALLRLSSTVFLLMSGLSDSFLKSLAWLVKICAKLTKNIPNSKKNDYKLSVFCHFL